MKVPLQLALLPALLFRTEAATALAVPSNAAKQAPKTVLPRDKLGATYEDVHLYLLPGNLMFQCAHAKKNNCGYELSGCVDGRVYECIPRIKDLGVIDFD